MPGRPWLGYFRPHPGSETPAWLRLFIAAVSGAALSFSYTGFYLSIYSWVCVGILLIVLFGRELPRGVRLRIPARHLFCADVRLVDRGNSLRAWRALSRRWMGRLAADCLGLGRSERRGHLGDQPAFAAKYHARLLWRAVPLGFARNVSHLAAGNQFSVEPAGLSGLGKCRAGAAHDHHRNLRFVVSSSPRSMRFSRGATPHTKYSPKRRLAILRQCCGAGACGDDRGAAVGANATANHTARAVQLNFPEAQDYPNDWFTQHIFGSWTRFSASASRPLPIIPISWYGPKLQRLFLFKTRNSLIWPPRLAIRFQHPFIVGVVEWKPETVSRGRNDSRDHGALQQCADV